MKSSFVAALACLALAAPVCAPAQRGGGPTDSDIVQGARLVATGEQVALHQNGVSVDAAFLALAEEACRKIEALIGRKLDTATLGEKIRIYVANSVVVSHVWGGYGHPQDPQGIVFLNPRVYLAALRGADATYIHELSHLYTWRYSSHTLREGLADYLALAILPGASVGPNRAGHQSPPRISAEIAEYLGTSKPPPVWVTMDVERRRAYYAASYHFVKYLVESRGMPLFLKLYESSDPEAEMPALYGAAREVLVRRALEAR